MRMTEIKPAISRSISHNEIVIVETPNPRQSLESIDNDENVTALDWCEDVRGCGVGLDVWGMRMGQEFRLFLLQSTLSQGLTV